MTVVRVNKGRMVAKRIQDRFALPSFSAAEAMGVLSWNKTAAYPTDERWGTSVVWARNPQARVSSSHLDYPDAGFRTTQHAGQDPRYRVLGLPGLGLE